MLYGLSMHGNQKTILISKCVPVPELSTESVGYIGPFSGPRGVSSQYLAQGMVLPAPTIPPVEDYIGGLVLKNSFVNV